MRKNLKYFIDVLLFVDVTSLAAIGLLLGFVIPSGKQAGENKYFMGIHRHDWGDIHLYLALLFVALLALHIWLNWTWIVQVTKGYVGDYWKKVLLTLCGAWVLVLLVAWLALRF